MKKYIFILSLSIIVSCTSNKAIQSDEDITLDQEVQYLNQQSKKIIDEANQESVKNQRVIRENDKYEIEVWMKDLSHQFAGFPLTGNVPSTGEIFVPHIGTIKITGLTDEELKQKLSQEFSKLLKNATVVVSHQVPITNNGANGRNSQAARRFSILGRVEEPGMYTIAPGLRIVDAIATAKGFLEFANESAVYVVTGDIHNPTVKIINVKKIMYGKDLKNNILIQPNDAIYVPPIAMWKVYDVIRKVLLPITAVRDAVWVTTITFN